MKTNNKYLNAMRSVATKAIYDAKQGHTGMAISAIPLVYTLYTNHICIAKKSPKWINRDRFILSAGHGSMSLYSLFYLSSLIDKNEIKQYRQENSLTPGHPEVEDNNYIDCSTGPLGQGIAMAVGMSMAQAYLEKKWKKFKDLIDHYTYVIVGDGDLQEGVCYEAMSLAGKLKLNKLIVLHDSNDYQLDSSVLMVNNENIKKRVEAQNWLYLKSTNDINEINKNIELAKKSKIPAFIEIKTIIGEGTSQANNFKAHGLKIDDNELKNIQGHFNFEYNDNYQFDDDITKHFYQNVIVRGENKYNEWKEKLHHYEQQYPRQIKEFLSSFNTSYNLQKLEKVWKELILHIDENVPTKTYVKWFFDACYKHKINDMITLSADLASTTNCQNAPIPFNENRNYPYVMTGIREFCMACMQNGILLHGGLKSFCGTFLTFADYLKPAMRLGCLSKLPSIYIFTHDSYQVGGDGPTHQPYDQLTMIRAVENSYVIRPCNLYEFINGLKVALNSQNETYSLVLTRQNVNIKNQINHHLDYGAYIFHDCKNPKYTIIANGSEIELIMNNLDKIKQAVNGEIKVISCPILKLFIKQDEAYKNEILKAKEGVLVIEASNDYMWYELSNNTHKLKMIKANSFGKSMDGKKLYEQKGFNVRNIIEQLMSLSKELNEY